MRTSRPLRVLWLIKGLGPGGAERLLVTLAEVRDPAAVEYHVAYVLGWKRHLVPQLEAAGVRTELLGGGRLGRFLWPWRLRRCLVRGGYDVVHMHSPALAAIARVMVRTLRQRPGTVYTEHNHWQAYGRMTRIANRVTHAWDDKTFAVSRAVRDSIRPPRRQSAVTVLIHGINRAALASTRSRSEVRCELGLGEDDEVVITVANMRPQKAYPDLLAAAEIVIATRGHVHFLAVGQGPLLEQTRAEVLRRGLDGRFHVLGERHDVFDLLNGADVFALASIWEGFPIAVMEAMSMGLPCAATRVGGVPDAIDDGVEGILVEPRRPERMAEAVLSILADPRRRDAMGRAARARAVGFDIRNTSATLAHTYQEVAGVRPLAWSGPPGRRASESQD